MSHDQRRRLTVHSAGGAIRTIERAAIIPDSPGDRDTRVAEHAPITEAMTTDIVCMTPDLEVATLVTFFMERPIGCMPVIDADARPIGVVTKLDLVYWLTGAPHARAETVEHVMMPMVITLPEAATIAQAAKLMKLEDTHHVLVVDEQRRLTGVVSSKDIATWLIRPATGPVPVEPEEPWLPYIDPELEPVAV